MEEIAAWLRAQAEADIKAAGTATDGPWEIEGSTVRGAARGYSGGKRRDVLVVGHTWRPEADHMVRHDPLTETARAESVLALLDLYERQAERTGESALQEDRTWTLQPVIVLLACGYRHREGFKAEWAQRAAAA